MSGLMLCQSEGEAGLAEPDTDPLRETAAAVAARQASGTCATTSSIRHPRTIA
jgi:hypothetical protein